MAICQFRDILIFIQYKMEQKFLQMLIIESSPIIKSFQSNS